MSDDTTQILISWLRCFDDDENDQRMAARCADSLERLNAVYLAAKKCDIMGGVFIPIAIRKELYKALSAVEGQDDDH